MDLQQEIDARRAEIRTDEYAMSIGEWISLYENKELDIHPEFQRFFRWSIWQKSRLIESILLGIPIPTIFVSQRKDGVWDVVDGLQRLSTIFNRILVSLNHDMYRWFRQFSYDENFTSCVDLTDRAISEQYDIATSAKTVTDIGSRYCRKLQRADGYGYRFQVGGQQCTRTSHAACAAPTQAH